MALSGREELAYENFQEVYNAEEDGIAATTIVVRNRSSSTEDLLVCIPELHGGTDEDHDDFATIIPGDFQPFRVDDQGMKKMFIAAQQNDGGAYYDFWIAARTRQR